MGDVITHPEKVLFPEDGITKGELAAYYETIAPLMLPHIQGRPVTMERYPSGIGTKGFMHKDVVKGFPDWLERVEAPKKDGTVHYPVVRDARALRWLANQNCITPHVWTSRAPRLFHPDVCVVDLDPSREDAAALRAAVLGVRGLLTELGLSSQVKTSGSKGFHVVVPLDAEAGFDVVSRFANRLAEALVARDPERLTLAFSKAERGGRIYVDVGRNGPGATIAAAYAVRARPGAPVSAPCTWDEIEKGQVGPRAFTLRTMAARVASAGDVWAEWRGQSLAGALERLRAG